MTKLSVALAALALSAPAVASAQDIAPPVKRKPVASATAPAPPQAAPGTEAQAPQQAPATAGAAPQQVVRTGSHRDYQAALAAAAAQDTSEPALDGSLVRVMSGLIAAGRCTEAVGLATRDGRKALATRAQQLCK